VLSPGANVGGGAAATPVLVSGGGCEVTGRGGGVRSRGAGGGGQGGRGAGGR
jgi:hypothetical protein